MTPILSKDHVKLKLSNEEFRTLIAMMGSLSNMVQDNIELQMSVLRMFTKLSTEAGFDPDKWDPDDFNHVVIGQVSKMLLKNLSHTDEGLDMLEEVDEFQKIKDSGRLDD